MLVYTSSWIQTQCTKNFLRDKVFNDMESYGTLPNLLGEIQMPEKNSLLLES